MQKEHTSVHKDLIYVFMYTIFFLDHNSSLIFFSEYSSTQVIRKLSVTVLLWKNRFTSIDMLAANSKFTASCEPPNSYIESKMHPLQLKKRKFRSYFQWCRHNNTMIYALTTSSYQTTVGRRFICLSKFFFFLLIKVLYELY